MTTATPRARVRARALAVLVHRWVGLAVAVFLLVAGVTGSVLVFQHELDAALNPTLYQAPGAATGLPVLDPEALAAAVEARLPRGAHVTQIALDVEPGHAAMIGVDAPASAGRIDDQYFVDPHTGELLGSRRWGELRQGRVNLLPFVMRLHYSLGLGEVGMTLMGVVALLWTFDCFVAAALTLPAPAPRQTWLRRWRRSWRVRAREWFALVFTWHRASGLWIWAMLLVFAWSAVALNLGGVYRPVMAATLGLDLRGDEVLLARDGHEYAHDPGLDWTAAREHGRQRMLELAAARELEILAERRIAYDASRRAYRYQVRSSLDISARYPATTLWIDADSGVPLHFDPPTGARFGTTVTTWLYHLHFGSWLTGGLAYRVFVFVLGLAIALLSGTGVLIWLRKRSKRRVRTG